MASSADEQQMCRAIAASDKAKIMRPDTWSKWPTLPMKRYDDNGMNTGFMLDGVVLPTVFHGNLFILAKATKDKTPEEIKAHIDSLDREEFTTIDDLLKGGWKID